MDRFLAAQADDPFDPAPMLILADSLEEAGHPVGAAVLRGLVENGTPSLHALALGATLSPMPATPGQFKPEHGDGHGFEGGSPDAFLASSSPNPPIRSIPCR